MPFSLNAKSFGNALEADPNRDWAKFTDEVITAVGNRYAGT
jgi:hypothetical protein